MQTIDSYNFSGKKAIVRVDFNVPIKEGKITDDTRMTSALQTINKILSGNGAVILMSHLGRPDGAVNPKYSLSQIVAHLSSILNKPIQFADDCIGNSAVELSSKLKAGEVLLLENLRFYAEEEKGDEAFAGKLAKLADVYVNDAFGTAHRAHASTAVIAKFFANDKLFGYLMESEVVNIEKVLHNPGRPFTAILGGAKVSDKIKVIDNLMEKVNNLIIGGGMAYTFAKAMGGNIGKSLCEADKLDLAKQVIEKAKAKGINLYLPTDSLNADKFDNAANTEITKIGEVREEWLGLDIAEETIATFSQVIENSSTILWNGPMGVFEMETFSKGTKAVAEAIARATAKGAYSLIGGGDSVAAINKYKLEDKVSYVSTGGGAMLEFIEGKYLPGIKAIRESI